MNLTSGFYRADEIKYKIDRACGICMFEKKMTGRSAGILF